MFYVEPARTELLELLKDPYHLDSFQELLKLFVAHVGFDVLKSVKVRHALTTRRALQAIINSSTASFI